MHGSMKFACLFIALASPALAKSPSKDATSTTAAIRWLKRSEVELGAAESLPHNFPKDRWLPEIMQAYVDSGNPKLALDFLQRRYKDYPQACGRQSVVSMVVRLGGNGNHAAAKKTASLLLRPGIPYLLGYSASENERLCAAALVDVAWQQALAGEFAAAAKTADMIPAARYPDDRAAAFYWIAVAHARHGDAKGIQRHAREFLVGHQNEDQQKTVTLSVELAMADRCDDALRLTSALPSSNREDALERISLAHAAESRWDDAVRVALQIPTSEDRQLTLLRIVTVRTWRGDLDGALELVKEHFPEDSFSARKSRRYSCRDSIGRALAWRRDLATASQYASDEVVESIRSRLVLEPFFDFTEDEEYLRAPSTLPGRSCFEPPHKLINSGTTAFSDARDEAVGLLNALARRVDLRAAVEETAQLPEADDFDHRLELYSFLGAICAAAAEREMAVGYYVQALDACDQIDFRRGNVAFLLASLVRLDQPERALQYVERIIQVDAFKGGSQLAPQVAFALAEAGHIAHLEKLLALAPRQPDRALMCVAAAHGLLSPPVPAAQVPTNGHDLVMRCGLDVPLSAVLPARR